MKKLILVLTVILTSNTFANLTSKFDSTVHGINIPNTHSVNDYETVLRGMAPKSRINELVDFGITDVLIFKNQTRNEVDKEITKLKAAGYSSKNIHHIPFVWKDLKSFQGACEQTIQALKLLKQVHESQDRKIFFHCTVGEDRTGHLAGIWQMLLTGDQTKEVFQTQMCERGFGAGNNHKPTVVVNAIRKGLTPLFFKMAKLVEDGHLSYETLDIKSCQKLEWVKNLSNCEMN